MTTSATAVGTSLHTPISIDSSSNDSKEVAAEQKGGDPSAECVLSIPQYPSIPKSELEPVEIFVKQAIDEFSETSESENYTAILEALRTRADVPLLVKVLVSFGSSGALAVLATNSTKHQRLVHKFVRFNPFTKEGPDHIDLVNAHCTFLSALASANTVFAVPILSSLWTLIFTLHRGLPDTDNGLVDISSNDRFCRIHSTMAHIISLVPAAAHQFPATGKPPHYLSWNIVHHFQHALFAVRHYCPNVFTTVLLRAIHTTLDLDVELRINDMGVVEYEPQKKEGEESAEAPASEPADKPEQPEEPNTKRIKQMTKTLDQLMLLMLDYLLEHRQQNQDAVYDFLSKAFNMYIISTHKSKFVQFLLFATVNQDTLLYREFLRSLLDTMVNSDRATVTRQTAACYVASFVSRSVAVSAETAQETAGALLHCAETYIEQQEQSQEEDEDDEDHALFYTICQAAFYIVCFRGNELLPHADLGKDRWQYICQHKLQPLQHCLESVREEFSLLALRYDLLDTNNTRRSSSAPLHTRSRLRRRRRRSSAGVAIRTPAVILQQRLQGGVGGLGRGTNPLDSFFPFDPYLLRESYQFIEPLYRHWDDGVNSSGDEAEEPVVDKGSPPLDQVDVPDANPEEDPNVDSDEMEEVVSAADEGEEENNLEGDEEDDEPPSQRRKRLLSIASNATSVSSAPQPKRPLWKKWQETLERSRTESIDTTTVP